jgi:predicted nucleotidyltransferase
MVIIFENHKIFLKRLVEAGIDFILVGGYAVNFHGYNRPTGDMDIWLKPSNENKNKLLQLLKKEGYSEKSLAHIRESDFNTHLAFHIGNDPFRIDFLTYINGVEFEEAQKQQQSLPLDNIIVPVLHLHHLVLSKMNTERIKDKADIEELQKRKKNK